MMNDEGLENVLKDITIWPRELGRSNRMGIKNCAVDSKWHSDTVTAIRVPQDIDANDVIKTAYYKYGFH